MIGIVLVTHGNLARGLIAALEHVVGPQQCVSAVCIGADDDMEKRRAEILESVKACDTGDGVIVLTDLFGGTPCNLAISIMGHALQIRFRAGKKRRLKPPFSSVRDLYWMTISTRRFCGSRTPSPVCTSRPCSPRPTTEIACAGTPSRTRASFTALARRSDSAML